MRSKSNPRPLSNQTREHEIVQIGRYFSLPAFNTLLLALTTPKHQQRAPPHNERRRLSLDTSSPPRDTAPSNANKEQRATSSHTSQADDRRWPRVSDISIVDMLSSTTRCHPAAARFVRHGTRERKDVKAPRSNRELWPLGGFKK